MPQEPATTTTATAAEFAAEPGRCCSQRTAAKTSVAAETPGSGIAALAAIEAALAIRSAATTAAAAEITIGSISAIERPAYRAIARQPAATTAAITHIEAVDRGDAGLAGRTAPSGAIAGKSDIADVYRAAVNHQRRAEPGPAAPAHAGVAAGGVGVD